MIAGIDGGGTHTRLEIRDGENKVLCREVFGPFNLNSIGEEAFRKLLRQVFDFCGGMASCEKLCVGAAGISNPAVGEILAQELSASGFAGRFTLRGDQEIALRGAMDEPGVAVISGTGSICFGKNKAGQTARSGGYGHLIDDGGSGYALGRAAFAEAVRALDGRGGDPEILAAVLARLDAKTPGELVAFVYGPGTDKSAIAQFSAIVLHQAEKGNRRAKELLEEQARELYLLADAVQRQLGLHGCPIALLGGLLEADNVYRTVVARTLSPLGNVIYPAHDALWGAAQMAWELS